MDNEKKSKKVETGGILFALFVVFLGVFSLLFDVPLLAGLFRLVSFWPLLIVGIGVWVIFKNVNKERLGVIVLAVILIAAMYSAFSTIPLQLESLDEKSVPSGVTDIDVSIDLLFGTFSIGSTESLYLVKGQQPMKISTHTAGATAHLDFSLQEEAFVPFGWSSNQYEILLNQHLPLSINAATGVSSCHLDFSQLNVEEFSLDGGVSSIEIIFGESETNTTADISMGVSSVTIYVPKSVGVKITADGFLSLSVPPDWIKVGNGYKSPLYDTATYTIDITCDMGLGSLTIVYI